MRSASGVSKATGRVTAGIFGSARPLECWAGLSSAATWEATSSVNGKAMRIGFMGESWLGRSGRAGAQLDNTVGSELHALSLRRAWLDGTRPSKTQSVPPRRGCATRRGDRIRSVVLVRHRHDLV